MFLLLLPIKCSAPEELSTCSIENKTFNAVKKQSLHFYDHRCLAAMLLVAFLLWKVNEMIVRRHRIVVSNWFLSDVVRSFANFFNVIFSHRQ